MSAPALVILLLEEGAHIQCPPAYIFCEKPEQRLPSLIAAGALVRSEDFL